MMAVNPSNNAMSLATRTQSVGQEHGKISGEIKHAPKINVPIPTWHLTQPPNHPATALAWNVIFPPLP